MMMLAQLQITGRIHTLLNQLDGDSVRVNSNGRTGTIAQWSSLVSQRWEVTSENDLIEVTALRGLHNLELKMTLVCKLI